MDDLDRAIALHARIEDLRHEGSTRQLRLKEKLELMRSWKDLKTLVLIPCPAAPDLAPPTFCGHGVNQDYPCLECQAAGIAAPAGTAKEK